MPIPSQNSHSFSELIRLRTSRRTFEPAPLPEEVVTSINLLISNITEGPLGTPLAFSLISQLEVASGQLKLGTYGFIRGARNFIVGTLDPSATGFLDYGYTLERLILELTGLGLGTCWLGGTFNRGEFARAIDLRAGQVIPAITPVGYASGFRRFGERLIRIGAGSSNRLPAEKIFFLQSPDVPLPISVDHPLASILEGVRLAPSASNIQPWRIIADGNLFRFYLARKPGYRKVFDQIDLQMIDMGIAMAHFDLAARESGLVPEWEISKENPPVNGWEYVISVFLPA